jgi:acetolactate synthase-1/3 small subunit
LETGKHTLIALLENRPGALNRVVSLFRRRGFNLDSLTVGRTDSEEISRMTVVVQGNRAEAERLARELDRLVSVIRVEPLNGRPAVSRDLALIKVTVDARTRPEVSHLCDVFRARIIDVAPGSVIVELTGSESKIEGFAELLRPLGIIEMVRTGLVAMTRADHVLDRHGYESSWVEHRNQVQAGRLAEEVA